MPTEEGNVLLYNEEYYICYFANHEFFKGTRHERKLFTPYKCEFHKGTRPNLFGAKVFEKKENADKWCANSVNNFILLAKPNYKSKDGTIKKGIEIDGKFYAPKDDGSLNTQT